MEGTITTSIGINYNTSDQNALVEAGFVDGAYKGNAFSHTHLSLKSSVKSFEESGMTCVTVPEKYEDFWIYDRNEEANIVFHGATKLPTDDIDTMFAVANYWLKCLTEITNILPACVWTVFFEEVPLILDPVKGWRFLSDEEYKLYQEG